MALGIACGEDKRCISPWSPNRVLHIQLELEAATPEIDYGESEERETNSLQNAHYVLFEAAVDISITLPNALRHGAI